MSYNSPENIPAEQPQAQATANRPISIGLPASSSATERRFPITPEAANILTERGYTIIMESEASAPIHYSDNRYTRSGVKVAGRAEALGCDIVIHLAPLSYQDVKKMRRGAMLLTLFDSKNYSIPEEIVLQLTHKDVYLGFFKERKKEILSLRSGNSLEYKNAIFYNVTTKNPIAKLSKNMQFTIDDWQKKGYEVKSASVRFVVAWKPKDAPKEESETAVILIDVSLVLKK